MKILRPDDPGPFSRPGEYKTYLQPVFRARCAYCLAPDNRNGGPEGMTVDHFWPQSRFPHLRLNWTNLYYSCSVCNENYKKDHPTEQEEATGCRFVDPCQEDPDDHFRMTRSPETGDYCCVRALTDAARYTLRILRLDRRKQLRDFWRELDHHERTEHDHLAKIEAAIAGIDRDLKRRGSVEDIEQALGVLMTLRNVCRAKLEDIRSLRPFPVEP